MRRSRFVVSWALCLSVGCGGGGNDDASTGADETSSDTSGDGDGDGDTGDGDGDTGDGDGDMTGDGDGDSTGDGDGDDEGDGDGDSTGDGDGDGDGLLPDTERLWFVDVQDHKGKPKVEALPDGGALIYGSFETEVLLDGQQILSTGDGEAYVLRLDAAGDLVWATGLTGPDLQTNTDLRDVTVLADDTIVIAGAEVNAFLEDASGFAALLGADGVLEEQRSLPAAPNRVNHFGTDLYFCGQYEDQLIELGCGPLPTPSTDGRLFFARTKRDGSCVWTAASTDEDKLECTHLDIGSAGEAWVSGRGECFTIKGQFHQCAGAAQGKWFGSFDAVGGYSIYRQTERWTNVTGSRRMPDGEHLMAGMGLAQNWVANEPRLLRFDADAALVDHRAFIYSWWSAGIVEFELAGSGWWFHDDEYVGDIPLAEQDIPAVENCPSCDRQLTLLAFDPEFTMTHAHRWGSEAFLELVDADGEDGGDVVIAFRYGAGALGSPELLANPNPLAIRIERHTRP